MATKTYKPKRKISATESEEIKIPASSVDGLSTVATSGSYNDLSNKPTIPDVSGKANLSGGNTFTGKQTLNSPPSDGYSIDAAGYVKGSWLQAPSTGKASSNTGKVCVLDGSGWVYYRTPAEIVSDGGGAKASDIPTKTSQLTNDSGYTTNKGTVTQVKINGTTKSPNSAGLVDLGTISGGGGGGATTYSDYISASDAITIFGKNEYGNAFIFSSGDGGQGIEQMYTIYVNGVMTEIFRTNSSSDNVDHDVCINISRFDQTSISSIIVNVFYKNTVKTIHISDTPNSTVDLGYYDNGSQSTTLFLTITKGII